MAEFQWTRKRQIAAQLIAESDKSLTEIAQAVGVKPNALATWRKNPEFIDRVAEIRVEMAEALKRAGLRVRENRLNTLNDVFKRIYKVIEGRASAYGLNTIPGGDTGLIVRRVRHFGEEYVFDRALIQELREVMKHSAIEVGEWIEKSQIDAGDSKPLPLDIKLTIDKVYGEPEGESGKADGDSSKETTTNTDAG